MESVLQQNNDPTTKYGSVYMKMRFLKVGQQDDNDHGILKEELDREFDKIKLPLHDKQLIKGQF